MAIVTNNAKIVTGTATNTLGTLGRSLFNSTIGTFADKDTMNQIYGLVDKLNSSIETTDKTVDFEAVNGRNKADDLFTLLAGLDIKSSSDFMNKNREFMKRLMRLNKQEKDITLDAIGVDVTGESDIVRNEYVRNYDHVQGNNYYEDYVKTLPQNQQIGDETTTLQLESSTNFNYAGLHNDLYVTNQNLYPDDENKGTFANKWIVENKNSLLYKTKKLFNSNKINTIISRFHTNPSRRPSLLDNAKSKYGLSHGRNLLTAQAENGLSSAYNNGYDNPYCRVWTHHHQYDRYYKTIRPFSSVDDQGNYIDTISVEDFHQWGQFSDSNDTPPNDDGGGGTQGKWGWKKDKNNGWQYSVLQDNGMVNITPKYINGASSNIHTKQCMFSIENLAWRGYDPYSFEQALSWEQRGPLGGRIMWFPPYGIQFNETTSTQWANNTFLGRGEDVYTYTNTTRTGSLSFMMVVDHPSILDYVSWTEENRNVTDTDILRFLAGCGEGGDGNGLRSKAKPTPLTDEYTQVHSESFAPQELVEDLKEVKIEEQKTPDDEKPLTDILCFYVFYPNNYSGTYDDKEGECATKAKNATPSKVEPIPYLIAGSGAQKSSGDYTKGFDNDIPIDDATIENWTGTGYEMSVKGHGLGGVSNTNYISGTSLYPNMKVDGKRRYWKGLGTKGRQVAYNTGLKNPSKCKKWYYRIDGRYMFPQDAAMEEKSHYYNQTLAESGYKDETSFGLNNSIEVLATNFADQIEKNDKNEYTLKSNKESLVYTLAEIAYVLYDGVQEKQKKCNIKDVETNNRIIKLKELLLGDKVKEIKSITGVGYASSHGYVATNQKLGQHRAESAAHWFLKNLKERINITPKAGYEPIEGNIGEKDSNDKTVEDRTTGDEAAINAKKWRYARIEIAFETAANTAPPVANNDTEEKEDEEEVDTSGFYYKTKKTPIDKDTIENPPYTGVYDSNYKVSKLEITKTDNTFYFTLNDGNDVNGKQYKNVEVINYKEVTKSGITCRIKDGKSYEIKKQISFTTLNKDGDNDLCCVIYDYGEVICFAVNEKENYYNIEADLDESTAFKHTFVDVNPDSSLLKNSQKWMNSLTNPNLKIKQIEYDGKHTLKIVDDKAETKTFEVVSSKFDKDKEYIHLNIDCGGKISVSKEPIKIDVATTYVTISALSSVQGFNLVGTNCYYKKKAMVEVSKDTMLNISYKGAVLLNLTNDTLTMKYKNTTTAMYNYGVEIISENYPDDKYSVKDGGISKTTEENNVSYTILTNEGETVTVSIKNNKNVVIRVATKTFSSDKTTVVINDVSEEPSKAKSLVYSSVDNSGGDSSSGSGSSSGNGSSSDGGSSSGSGSSSGNGSSSDGGSSSGTNTSDKTTTLKEVVVVGNAKRKYVGYRPANEKGYYKGEEYEIYLDNNGKKWYRITEPYNKVAKFISVGYASETDVEPIERYGNGHGDENRLRYDQEYHFFKVLKQTDPVVYGSLMDKLKYFDPAFHSMTPEGFNGRLTFLQQCMRQGNTVSASDGKFSKSANNLAFGRAPYCVLRLGDFYNQMIVIDNLSISYDPLVWDLNVEGVGVQPLIAHVQLSFKFVGGGDMTGPVRRLQNAMSFNYYANARLYDNRADRVERMWSDKTNGAIEHDEILETSADYKNAADKLGEAKEQQEKLKELRSQQRRAEKKEKVYNKDGKSSTFYTTKMYQ